MDIGSYLVIKLMNLTEKDWIVDLCCAPGSKLLFIIDQMKSFNNSKIAANDISQNWLNTAKSIIRKYGHLSKVSFTNKDACLVSLEDLGFSPNKILVDVECSHDGSFKHILKYINDKNDQEWSVDGFKSKVLQTHKTDQLRTL